MRGLLFASPLRKRLPTKQIGLRRGQMKLRAVSWCYDLVVSIISDQRTLEVAAELDDSLLVTASVLVLLDLLFFLNNSALTEIYALSLHDAFLFFLKERTPHLQSPFYLVCRLLL